MRNVLLLIAFVAFGCFGAVKTDTLKAKDNTLVVKDTTKFLKKVTALVIGVDSLAGNVKIGGNLNIGSINAKVPTPTITRMDNSYTDDTADTKAKLQLYNDGTGVVHGMGVSTGATNYYTTTGGEHVFRTGNTRRLSINTTGTNIAGACTTTTLNTGNGDCELYAMNQAVRTTDDPTFDSNTVTDLKVLDDATIDDDLSVGGGITIAGGSQLTAYLDTTFYDSLYDNTTYRDRALCRIVQVGKLVTLYQPAMTGAVSGGAVYIKGIPSKFSPSPLIIFSPTLYGSIAGTYTNLLFTYDSNYYLSTISNTNIGAGTLLVTYSIVSWILN